MKIKPFIFDEVRRLVFSNNCILKLKFTHSVFCILLISCCTLISNIAKANNIAVSNVTLSGLNTTSKFVLVEFDISWDNSWRVSTGPSNWDAAWVFIKYRKNSSDTWNHATLNWVNGTGNGDGHTEPINSDINSSQDISDGSFGVFIRRNANFAQGSVNYNDVQLRWNYGRDGLLNADSVELWVYAIEMVYVPQGSFYIGDGSTTSIQGQFESGTTGNALQITSEGALTLGGGGAGSLGNNNASGMVANDDFDDITSKTLPSSFPKGYNAFYCMKYEITQEQYVTFLNMLTYSQQQNRTAVAPNSAAGTGALISTNSFRNGIDIKTPGTSAVLPAVYACNLDGDATYNETSDGQNVACNYISWSDIAAYLDWTALRPMSELEFEKAARGTIATVADEFAWGSTAITGATGINNGGISNETSSNGAAKCAYNNHGSVQGPMRVGCFGQGVNTRVGVGAGYFGIMELSGNVYERSISVGKSNGRPFTGAHGDGEIDGSGLANVTNWPLTASGVNYRGGGWSWSSIYLRVSDRYYGANTYGGRTQRDGGRGVRSAP